MSPKILLDRARILVGLREYSLARRDILAARCLDPVDPELLGLSCRIEERDPGGTAAERARAHAAAVELLGNDFADIAQRRLALSVLDPDRLPITLRRDLPMTSRLTLIQRTEDRIDFSGLSEADVFQPLGKGVAGGMAVFALDCFLERRPEEDRHLAVTANGTTTTVHVPALPGAPGAKVAPVDEDRPVWIVMPVKDGGAVLEASLKTVLAGLDELGGGFLVLVDDGSTQARTRRLLERAARRPDVRLLRTVVSTGFTAAVNLGLQAVGRGPVLLLNSDIWMPRGVLRTMLAHLNDPGIGTVTPLSNDAGGVSLLGPGRRCTMPPPTICDRLAGAARALHPGVAVDIPNGNGFCLLISASCLRRVGPLSGHYESGYYEEVDFCLRASRLGYRHVAAADSFVGHVGSVSYGTAKARLVAGNRRRLAQRFPDYGARYQGYVALDPLAPVRKALLAAVGPDWQPSGETAAGPEGEHVLQLGAGSRGPVLIPVTGDGLPAPLRDKRFERLRFVPAGRLSAMGLRLQPDHDLAADWLPEDEELRLSSRRDGPIAGLYCREAAQEDLRSFEAAVLGCLHDHVAERGAHAIQV